MSGRKYIAPPEWPFKFLRAFCKDSLIERIEGDMLETYDYRLKKIGAKKAKLLLYRDVFSMLRPFAIRGLHFKNSNNITMLSNYFKLTLRGINTNKTTSFISIFGLSIAVACCIILFVFGKNIVTANDFLKDGDKIHMVTSNVKTASGNEFIWGKSPESLGRTVVEDITDISYMSRYTRGRAVVRYGSKVIEEPIEFVDKDFLSLFSFELTDGDTRVLSQPSQIVMSKKIADKFFGDTFPLNQEVSLIIDGKTFPVTVGAVAAEFPTNTYFDFNILVNYQLKPDQITTSSLANATFIKFDSDLVYNQFDAQKKSYVEAYNSSNPRFSIQDLGLVAFDRMQNADVSIYGSVVGKENPSTLYGAIFFGLLLLFIACFNYINIALVSATKRLKEIGLRKSVGANRKQLIIQFISQNIFLCSFAVILGALIAQVILLPIFNSFFPVELSIGFTSIDIWIFLVAIALLTGFFSGIYPAFYISAFSANDIFKGSEKFGGNKNYLFRVFLGIQFGITFLIIFSGLAFIFNSSFQKNLSWGYDNANIVAIPTANTQQFLAFKNIVTQYPEIETVSGAKDHIGGSTSLMDFIINDQKSTVRLYQVDEYYFSTLKFKLLEGSLLNPEKISDVENGLLVNETFKKKYYVDNISNDKVITEEKRYNVVGVIEDFHYRDFYSPIEAVAFRLSSDSTNKYIVAKFSENTTMNEVLIKLKTDWSRMFPDYPFTGFAQNQVFDNFFREMSIPTNILILFASISMILSSIGLYGLVSLTLAKKMKEISIRKIMGASMKHISLITNKPYLIILLISLIVAVPVSQIMVKNYLDKVNAFHVPVDFKIIIPSTLVILLTICITIGINLLKVAQARAIDKLKEE